MYIIGGSNTKNIIARYNEDNYEQTWSKLSDLMQGRYGHGSISIDHKTLIIGGWSSTDTLVFLYINRFYKNLFLIRFTKYDLFYL